MMSCSVISIFRLARGGLFVQNIISVSYYVGVTVGVVSHTGHAVTGWSLFPAV